MRVVVACGVVVVVHVATIDVAIVYNGVVVVNEVVVGVGCVHGCDDGTAVVSVDVVIETVVIVVVNGDTCVYMRVVIVVGDGVCCRRHRNRR